MNKHPSFPWGYWYWSCPHCSGTALDYDASREVPLYYRDGSRVGT